MVLIRKWWETNKSEVLLATNNTFLVNFADTSIVALQDGERRFFLLLIPQFGSYKVSCWRKPLFQCVSDNCVCIVNVGKMPLKTCEMAFQSVRNFKISPWTPTLLSRLWRSSTCITHSHFSFSRGPLPRNNASCASVWWHHCRLPYRLNKGFV